MMIESGVFEAANLPPGRNFQSLPRKSVELFGLTEAASNATVETGCCARISGALVMPTTVSAIILTAEAGLDFTQIEFLKRRINLHLTHGLDVESLKVDV